MSDGHESILEVPARLLLDVLDKVAIELAMEGRLDSLDLERVLVGQRPDEQLLVGAEALHGGTARPRVGAGVPVDDLRRPVAGASGSRRKLRSMGGEGVLRRGAVLLRWLAVR